MVMASVIERSSLDAGRCTSSKSCPHDLWSKPSSAASAMRDIVSSTSGGSAPIAVSPESMTALVPSNTAFATSDASALVGLGDITMDSSICVAVITGSPLAMHWRMMLFCSTGTFWMGNSTPRSPRATMMAPDASMMLSRFSTAPLVSILETMSGPSGGGFVPRRRTSSPERTKEIATISMPSAKKGCSISKSSSVGEELLRRSLGM